MYIETSTNNHGNNVFVSLERTLILQTNNKTFYYNRHSISDPNSRSMGRFRTQLLPSNNTLSTRYNIPKIDRYSNSSTDLTSLNLTVEIYGIKLTYVQFITAYADMCFSKITITHSIY